MTERDIRDAIRATCTELDDDARQRGVAQNRGLRRVLLPALVGAGLAVVGCSDDTVVEPTTSTGTTSATGGGGSGQGGEAGQGGAGGQTAQGGGGQGGGGGDAGSGGMGAPVYMAPDVFV